MKIENTIKVIKEVHPDRVVMCKIGPFMHCYGRDAVIMSYLFDYSLKKIDNNYDCGFPNGALNKIMGTLEGKKISYMVVNRADNFAVENEEDLKENYAICTRFNNCFMFCKKKEGKMPSVICLQGRLYDTCKRPPFYDFCGMWCGLSRLPASTLTLRSRPLASLCVPVLLRHTPERRGKCSRLPISPLAITQGQPEGFEPSRSVTT